LLKWLFNAVQPMIYSLTFSRFSRLFSLHRLPAEWVVKIRQIVKLHSPIELV